MSDNDKSSWEPVEGHIMTRWAKDVDPKNPLPEYPRPQMKRNEWLNLNGLWDYAVRSKKLEYNDTFDGKILVPFAIESALSGLKMKFTGRSRLWYRRHFSIPEKWKGKNILLHFGSVDWEATVYVNGKKVGSHQGGYLPFSFDITEYLSGKKENELVVSVWDNTRMERGKQTLRPMMIYYTAISGIWQTAWLEPVSKTHVESLKMDPDIDKEILSLNVNVNGIERGEKVIITVKDGGNVVTTTTSNPNESIDLKIANPKLWQPDFPFLYTLIIKLERDGTIIDEIESYFGMRKISLGKDEDGHVRIKLNNEKIFQYGPLDQGYWPDGLYTAPTDEAMRYDIEITKELGFNMIRKHGVVAPLRWYYYCDKMGLLVWQDMPSGGWLFFRKKKQSTRDRFINELKEMMTTLHNSPSVVCWVPFNEGWGQFDTKKIVDLIKSRDPSRLIDAASGWFDKEVGDIRDVHTYPDPKMPKEKSLKGRAAVIGEFGGVGLLIKEHAWKTKFTFAQRKRKTRETLTEKYEDLMMKLKPMIKEGLCGAVYTQITDVEQEINGLLTYDREVLKIDKDKLKALHNDLYE